MDADQVGGGGREGGGLARTRGGGEAWMQSRNGGGGGRGGCWPGKEGCVGVDAEQVACVVVGVMSMGGPGLWRGWFTCRGMCVSVCVCVCVRMCMRTCGWVGGRVPLPLP